MSDLVVNKDLPVEALAQATPATALPAPGAPVGPSWLEQDEVLRGLWMQNKTPQEISSVLNRSVPAVMTRAARLGLPRRAAPGRKPGRRLLGVEGEPAAMAYIPRSEMRRASQPRTQSVAHDPIEAPATSLRVCLMCLRKFESAGRHNRICGSCKGSAEYETASALSDIHLPSS